MVILDCTSFLLYRRVIIDLFLHLYDFFRLDLLVTYAISMLLLSSHHLLTVIWIVQWIFTDWTALSRPEILSNEELLGAIVLFFLMITIVIRCSHLYIIHRLDNCFTILIVFDSSCIIHLICLIHIVVFIFIFVIVMLSRLGAGFGDIWRRWLQQLLLLDTAVLSIHQFVRKTYWRRRCQWDDSCVVITVNRWLMLVLHLLVVQLRLLLQLMLFLVNVVACTAAHCCLRWRY